MLAQTVATPPDRRYVEFRLNPDAKFSDGKPVLAKDVLFSWTLFTTKGRPNYRRNAEKVESVTTSDERTIRFTFKNSGDLELPLIIRTDAGARRTRDPTRENSRIWALRPFSALAPIGSRASSREPSIKLTRRPDYWGANLPAHRGSYNFDTIGFEFFRDSNTMFEAFKTGLIDFRAEADPTKWQTGYDVPAVRDGRILRESVPVNAPKGMSGFVFNTRRPPFSDIRVREAMFSLFDFEWLNANLFSNVYRRTGSFFDESELSFFGHAMAPREVELAGNTLETLPAAIKDGTWRPPLTDGSGRDRKIMRRATELLAEAGHVIRDGTMVDRASGVPFSFEIMVTTREKERIALAFADSLKQVGIRPVIRLVDSSQYWARLRDKQFGVILEGYVVGGFARAGAGQPLVEPCGGCAGHPQLGGGEITADRPHHRGHAGRTLTRGFRVCGTRARPAAGRRAFRFAALPLAGPLDCALATDRAPKTAPEIRSCNGYLLVQPESIKNGTMESSLISASKYSQLADPWQRLTVASLCAGAAAAHPSRLFIADCPDRPELETATPPRA